MIDRSKMNERLLDMTPSWDVVRCQGIAKEEKRKKKNVQQTTDI